MWSRLRRSWSLAFIAEHCRYLTLPSALRFWRFALRQARQEVVPGQLLRLRLRQPFAGDVWLRQAGSDELTFHEIVIEQVYRQLPERVRDCRYIIDLGGNIGLASLFLAAAYPRAALFVVEPDAGNFALLERNLAPLVRAGRGTIKRAAVWGSAAALVVTPPCCGGYSRIQVTARPPVPGDQAVPGVTMQQCLAECGFPRVDLLKIDIEGAEAEVFKGDLGWLERVHALAIEFHADSRRASGFDAIMQRYGFTVDDQDRHTVLATRSGSRAG